MVDKLSAEELSRLAGLSAAHVRLIETDQKPGAAGTTLLRIADVLGVTVDWLIAGKGESPDADHVRQSVTDARALRDAVDADASTSSTLPPPAPEAAE
jgi:transcriptional regulator with XRE-family HTH domain